MFPCLKQSGEAKVQRTVGVQTRVHGPHAGIRLTQRAYGVFHRPSPDGVTAGGKGAIVVAVGKELEKRNWVGSKLEGIDAQAGTEGLPEGPSGIGGGMPLGGDAARERGLDSEPISDALVAGVSVCICQDCT